MAHQPSHQIEEEYQHWYSSRLRAAHLSGRALALASVVHVVLIIEIIASPEPLEPLATSASVLPITGLLVWTYARNRIGARRAGAWLAEIRRTQRGPSHR